MIKFTPTSDPSSLSSFPQKNVRLCANCKWSKVQPKSLVNDNKPNLVCSLYYAMDLSHGNKYYEDVANVRMDKDKCGIEGKYYEGRTKGDTFM